MHKYFSTWEINVAEPRLLHESKLSGNKRRAYFDRSKSHEKGATRVEASDLIKNVPNMAKGSDEDKRSISTITLWIN